MQYCFCRDVFEDMLSMLWTSYEAFLETNLGRKESWRRLDSIVELKSVAENGAVNVLWSHRRAPSILTEYKSMFK